MRSWREAAAVMTRAMALAATATAAAAALAMTLLAGCGGDELPQGCEASALTYETFGEAFLISWCRGCHSRDLEESMRQGAPLEVNFNALAEVRARARRVAFLVGEARTMPPAGGPGDGERALLVEWVGCGAP